MKALTKIEGCPNYQACLKEITGRYQNSGVCCIACPKFRDHQAGVGDYADKAILKEMSR